MKIQNVVEKLVVRYPKSIIVGILLLLVAATVLLPRLENNPDPFLLPKTHESRINLENMRDTYTGSRELMVVLLEAKDTIFKPETLERIQTLTEAFENIRVVSEQDVEEIRQLAPQLQGESREQVLDLSEKLRGDEADRALQEIRELLQESGHLTPHIESRLERFSILLNPVVEVNSLANTDNILGVDGGLDINPIYEDIPETEAELTELRENVMGNSLFENLLFTEDDKRTGIYLELALDLEDSQAIYHFLQIVKNILKDIPGTEQHYIAGFPVNTATITHVIDQDMGRLFPIVLVLVVACLWLTFRMGRGVLVPILVVVFSVLLTLALQVLFEMPINMVTATLPVFLIAIGVADGIHLFSEFREYRVKGYSRIEAVKETLRKLTMPVIMTSVTTAGAFWTLALTEVTQVKHFGILVGTGTMIAMFLSLVFIPALLLVIPEPKSGKKKTVSKLDKSFQNALEDSSRWVIAHSGKILVGAALIIIVAAYGISQIRVDTNGPAFFKPDTELAISARALNTKLSGSDVLNLLISGPEGTEPMKDPANLQIIDDLVTFLEAHPLVGKTTSLAGLVKRMNYVMYDNDSAYNRLPRNVEYVTEGEERFEVAGRDLIAQYLLLYENGGGDTLTDVVDFEYQEVNVGLILRTNSSYEVGGLMDEIRRYQQEHFPSHLSLRFAGVAEINTTTSREIVTGQVLSLGLSLVFVLGLLMVIFHSVQKGVLGVMPLIFSMGTVFGLLGLLRLPLDVGSALISSIAIGVGVDYSIHYLARLQIALNQGLSPTEAMLETVRHSGKAIASNAAVVGIGFLALLFSGFVPTITIGWMISLTMLIGCLSTLVLIPALLNVLKPQFLFASQPLTSVIEGTKLVQPV